MNVKNLWLSSILIAAMLVVTASAGNIEAGREVYTRYCVSCHGEEGDQLKELGVDFSSREYWMKKTDAEIRDVIWNGKGGMPPWKDALDVDDVDSVILYIKSLASLPSESTTKAPVEEPQIKKQPGFEITVALLGLVFALRKYRG